LSLIGLAVTAVILLGIYVAMRTGVRHAIRRSRLAEHPLLGNLFFLVVVVAVIALNLWQLAGDAVSDVLVVVDLAIFLIFVSGFLWWSATRNR
jgi:hypothetical protein